MGSVKLRFHCASADARVGPRHAAQQTVGGHSRRRVCRGQRAKAVGDRRRRDGIEGRSQPRQARQVGPIAQLAAEHRLAEHVAVVEHRMDDRDVVLHVGFREAVIVDAADVEIAAIAAAGQVQLRDAFDRLPAQETGGALVGREPVVLVVGRVARKHAIPAPHPLIAQRELARGFEAAAKVAIAWR